MEQLLDGHYYVTIMQGVSHGGGTAYYDVFTKDIIYENEDDMIRPKYLTKVTSLIDYIVSTKSDPYTFDEIINILSEITFLCKHKNDDLETKFGFPVSTLCYEDIDDDDEYTNESISESITRMENEYLQCDNADVFVISKDMWSWNN